MNPDIIHAAITKAHKKIGLTSRQTRRNSDYSSTRECGSISLSQFANWAGRGNPVELGASSAHHPALFAVGRFMAADSGQRSRWPVLVPVFHPAVSPPPFAVESEAADSTITRSPIMSATIKGEIRPISDRIQSALILAESATDILEKRDAGNIEIAAKTLLEAGLTLLGKSGSTYLVSDVQHACVFGSITLAKCALAHVWEEGDLPGGPDAIIGLILAELERAVDAFDGMNFSLIEPGSKGRIRMEQEGHNGQ